MDIQNMYVCRAMDGSYLQQVLALWRYNPEAVAQPLFLSPSLYGTRQQVHCVLPRLLLIYPVLHTTGAECIMLNRFTMFCLLFGLSIMSCTHQMQSMSDESAY